MESSAINPDHDPGIGEQDIGLLKGLDVFESGDDVSQMLFSR